MRRGLRVESAALLLVIGFASGPAAAQVMEIGDGGGVTVYDRPSVFTSDGAHAIQPKRARSAITARPPTATTGEALGAAARDAALSPDLVEAVAWQESRMRSGVVSSAGAIGEMQLMPSTARGLGVDPWDTRQNLHGGAAYLGGLIQRYDGDLVRALAAYNAGPGAVDRYRGVPPFRETQAYVAAIMNRLGQRAVQGGGPSER